MGSQISIVLFECKPPMPMVEVVKRSWEEKSSGFWDVEEAFMKKDGELIA